MPIQDEKKKVRPIETDQTLKEFLNGGGLLCLTLAAGDFLSVGASIYIGFARMNGNQIVLNLTAPRTEHIQRYKFRDLPRPHRLPFPVDEDES